MIAVSNLGARLRRRAFVALTSVLCASAVMLAGAQRADALPVICLELPFADFTFSPASPVTGQSVLFDASTSSGSVIGFDPPGCDVYDILTYSWDFNDGSPITDTPSPTISHTFASPGARNVELTVDDGLDSDSVTKLVNVSPAPPPPSPPTPVIPTTTAPSPVTPPAAPVSTGGTPTSCSHSTARAALSCTKAKTKRKCKKHKKHHRASKRSRCAKKKHR